MPFINRSIMSERIEFCLLASKPGSNISEICRRFRITRRTGYKWLTRYSTEGLSGLNDQSRRPHNFPNQTNAGIEKYVIKLRENDIEWGSKKLHKLMCNDKEAGKYKYERIPAKKQ